MNNYLTTDELIKYIARSRFNTTYEATDLVHLNRSTLEMLYNNIIMQEMQYNNLKIEICKHPKSKFNILNDLNAEDVTTAGV